MFRNSNVLTVLILFTSSKRVPLSPLSLQSLATGSDDQPSGLQIDFRFHLVCFLRCGKKQKLWDGNS